MRSRVCAMIVITLGALAASAQPPELGERYRLAQAYEQNGAPEEASRIYEDLFAANPRNDLFFSGVARTSLALKRYDTLATITRSRIATYGPSTVLYSLLGRALYHAGHPKEATVAWDSAGASAGTNEAEIRRIADDMIAAHAYEDALACYARAQRTLKNDLLFAIEQANLNSLLMRYKEATQGYVRILLSNQLPLPFVENRLSYFTSSDEGQHVALDVVREAARQHDDAIELQYLLAWLLMERKSYAEAFEVYTIIDERRNAGGQELVQFASRALSEGALDVAYRAFEIVRVHTSIDAITAWAEFGAASVHERLWRRDAPDSIAYARTVANEYDAVSANHSASTWADSATLRSAALRVTVLFDLEGAASRLRGLIGRKSRLARSGEPELMLANVFIAQNKLDSAAATALRVLRASGSGPDAVQHARFLLGELRYVAGDFDSALVILADCVQQPNAPYANDAILLTLMISENIDSIGRPALRTYASAELAARQHDFSRAIAALQDVVTQYPRRTLAEHALVAMGADYSAAAQFMQARNAYQRLLDQYSESILRDRAQIRLAGLLEGPLHDPAAAIHAYEVLLQNYPGSIFLEEARIRIRTLRAQL